MKTEILVITDRSGSMGTINSAACRGFNSFIDEQRGVPGDARVTLAMFSDTYRLSYQAAPLASVPYLESLNPGGMTAMYDAIGRTMDEQGRRIKAEGWADKVIVVIITDGQENASKQYHAGKIKQMIDHAREHGWEFVFLAANINTMEVADKIGIQREYAHSFLANAQGAMTGYATVSAVTRSLRGTSL